MSFVNEEDIIDFTENLLKTIFNKILNINLIINLKESHMRSQWKGLEMTGQI